MKTRICPQPSCGRELHPTQASNAKYCQERECIKERARIMSAKRLAREKEERQRVMSRVL